MKSALPGEKSRSWCERDGCATVDGKAIIGPQTASGSTQREEPAPNAAAEPSIWDTLDEDDRASIERGLAQSLAGVYATDEEVEAAWAAFGP